MRLTGLMAAAAVLSMVAAPAFAQPRNPAAKLSLNDRSMRAGAPMKRSSKAVAPLVIIVGLTMTAAVAGAVAASQSDSRPASA